MKTENEPWESLLWNQRDPKQKVLGMVGDLVGNFLYYDRKGDDGGFPVGKIEEMVAAGEISVDEMVDYFRKCLEASMK